MLRQLKLLLWLQLCDAGGLNVFRHSRDKAQKRRWLAMAPIWGLLVAMIGTYAAGLASGLASMGLVALVPAYLYMIASLAVLSFGIFKAGGMLFKLQSYELLAPLPLSGTAIVLSRFLAMYAGDLALTLVVLTPGGAVYVALARPGMAGCLYGVLGILFLPLLPLTLATALGAAVTAIGSRMRHKSLAIAGLTVLLILGITGGSMLMSGNAEALGVAMLQDISQQVGGMITKTYPPAMWFGRAVAGQGAALLGLLGLPLCAAALLVAVVQHWFATICTALAGNSAKGGYTLQSLRRSSALKALFGRELRRYFSSSVYVVNTFTGYLLTAVMGVAVFAVGNTALESLLGLPGILQKGLPLVMSATAALMPTTAAAISMEGAQWWLAKSLPLRSSTLFGSKILLNLAVALPGYVVAVVFTLLGLRPSFADGAALALVLAGYILSSSVVGLAVNLALPVFDWQSETRVVKQSAAVAVAMVCNLATLLPPAAVLFFLPDIPSAAVFAATTVLLLAGSALLFGGICRKNLLNVG